MISVVQCHTCKGIGKLDYVEERWEDGTWHRQRSPGVAHEFVDAWIAQEGELAPLRWAVGDCFKCAGKGCYEVETFPCLIF